MSMQKIFEALPPPGNPRSVVQIAGLTDMARKEVARICGKLLGHGFVERHERGVYRLTRRGQEARDAGYKITSGPNGPWSHRRCNRKPTARDLVWKCLRDADRAITIPDIQTFTGLLATNNIHVFLRALVRAGYAAVLPRRVEGTRLTSNGFKQYLLLQNTGPLTPSISKGCLYDPNTGEDIALEVQS